MLYPQAISLLLSVAWPLMANCMVIHPQGQAISSSSLGKFGNNLTLDDCKGWDTWEAPTGDQEVYHYYRSGYDDEGNVVYISEFGKLRVKKLGEESDERIQEFWKYYEQSLLRLEYDARHHNNGDGSVLIFDLEGFTLANYASSAALKISLKMFTTLVRLNNAIKYGFIINVNFAAAAFIQSAKPLLGNALDKFEPHGTRAAQWKPKLLRQIPAAQLPSKYGGISSWKPLPIHVCNV